MVLRPVDYLVHDGLVDGAAMWCIGFQKTQDQLVTILGDLVLKDKIFVYDLAHQRLGWADFDCSLSVNVSITASKDEFVNPGQLSVSGSSRTMLLKLALLTSCIYHFLSDFSYCSLKSSSKNLIICLISIDSTGFYYSNQQGNLVTGE
ncbi:aspartic proteinase-like protein 2 isoform X1 [Camellia sinensis]|uniref:aspartic proteinase-like protein 2 isoform X1 n=2 Tax=Camellia sinensis TaxID=4442 RepID=UPI0010369DE1|nr:aspartic proteinase-like protein 2 isoform X1 [Camellia sinensis]XP_028123145.1 aspartic proteinase-like protein 2 isoform X1 [Camellia sinensis]